MVRHNDGQRKLPSVWAVALVLAVLVSGAAVRALEDPSKVILVSDGFGYSVGVSEGLVVVGPLGRMCFVRMVQADSSR